MDEYLDIADSVRGDIAEVHPEWMALLREVDELWRTELLGDLALAPVPASLCLQSFYFWLAAVRVALSGHSSAVYPLLRTSLEAACYAYKIAGDPALSDIWLARDSSSESRKVFRSRFGQAVADVAKLFDDADLGMTIREMYDAAIDFGGHPNPRALLDHLTVEVYGETDQGFMSFIALNSARSFNVLRSIVAVVEHGYFSIAICANATNDPRHSGSLQARMDSLVKRVQALTAALR